LVGLEDRLALVSEVGEGLLEERLRRGIAPLVAPLTIKGMHEHPPRTAPAGIAHLPQPLDGDPRLARPTLGMQREDPHPLPPRPVHRLQLLLAADEAFAVDAELVGPLGFDGRAAIQSGPRIRSELGEA